MDEQQRRRYHAAAERGDLRPQFNRDAAAALSELEHLKDIEPILLDRFSQLHRPIGDASRGVSADLRLSDIGSFLYLVDSLRRLRYTHLEEMLCILLDEFSPFEERSYDELYLWCVVQLSRTDMKYISRYWPEVFHLDAHLRNADWRREPPNSLIDQPYRLTDLVLYYYEIYARPWSSAGRFPSVGVCLERLWPGLSAAQRQIVLYATGGLRMLSHDHAIRSGDTLALLAQRERQNQANPPASQSSPERSP